MALAVNCATFSHAYRGRRKSQSYIRVVVVTLQIIRGKICDGSLRAVTRSESDNMACVLRLSWKLLEALSRSCWGVEK